MVNASALGERGYFFDSLKLFTKVVTQSSAKREAKIVLK